MDLAQARRHAVLCEFIRPHQSHEDVGGFDAEAMADRIVRLERILHALREPSDEALVATVQAVGSVKLFSVKNIIRAAVAAAERDAVLEEFCPQRYRESPWQTIRKLAAEDMADEILRQRHRAERAERILAALREPSEAMRKQVFEAYFSSWDSRDIWTVVIHAAVAAAEQEVGRE